MTPRTIVLSLAAALALSASGGLQGGAPAAAQSCRPADSLSTDMIDEIVQYTAATDSAWKATRDALSLPAAAASEVVLITKEATCRSAVSAYRTQAQRDGGVGLSGRAYVVKAGKSTYVVWDPDYVYNPSLPERLHMTFDSHWRLLSRW